MLRYQSDQGAERSADRGKPVSPSNKRQRVAVQGSASPRSMMERWGLLQHPQASTDLVPKG